MEGHCEIYVQKFMTKRISMPLLSAGINYWVKYLLILFALRSYCQLFRVEVCRVVGATGPHCH
jgi:hypothetical protein